MPGKLRESFRGNWFRAIIVQNVLIESIVYRLENCDTMSAFNKMKNLFKSCWSAQYSSHTCTAIHLEVLKVSGNISDLKRNKIDTDLERGKY